MDKGVFINLEECFSCFLYSKKIVLRFVKIERRFIFLKRRSIFFESSFSKS